MKTTEQINQLINELIAQKVNEARESLNRYKRARGFFYTKPYGFEVRAYLPLKGYEVIKLDNNKPLTLLKAKEAHASNFVAFVNFKTVEWNGQPFDKVIFFDINNDKKTIEAGFKLRHHHALNDARKEEGTIYLLINKEIATFCNNFEKRETRNGNKTSASFYYTRFTKSDGINLEWELNNIISYESRWNIHPNLKGIDKSGYFVGFMRHKLQERAATLKNQRRLEAAKIKQLNYINDAKLRADNIAIIDNSIASLQVDLINAQNNLLSFSNSQIINVLNYAKSIAFTLIQLNNYKTVLNDLNNSHNTPDNAEFYTKKAEAWRLISRAMLNHRGARLQDIACYNVEGDKITLDLYYKGRNYVEVL